MKKTLLLVLITALLFAGIPLQSYADTSNVQETITILDKNELTQELIQKSDKYIREHNGLYYLDKTAKKHFTKNEISIIESSINNANLSDVIPGKFNSLFKQSSNNEMTFTRSFTGINKFENHWWGDILDMLLIQKQIDLLLILTVWLLLEQHL